MSGDLILIVFVLITAILAVLIAKLVPLYRGFAAHTWYICREMDRADNYEEYRHWRGELRCHYLCLIPFVNKKNVMRLYNKIYHRADKVKKERKDSLVPLLLPSILGIFICTICVCGMTWAWYTASVETHTQKLTSARYDVTVVSVMNSNTEVIDDNGVYSLENGIAYTATLKASGTVKECGYCLIQNEIGEKIYTQTFKPEESITVQITPKTSGNYTFIGVWGNLPIGTVDYLHNTEGVTDPIPESTENSVQSDPTGQQSEPTDGTYTVQSGDTLSAIAGRFNTTADKIAAYNNITDMGNINVGQVLNIPPVDYVIPETTAQPETETSVETTPTVPEPPVAPSPEPATAAVTEPTDIEPSDTNADTDNLSSIS